MQSVHIARVSAGLPEALAGLNVSDREWSLVTGISRPTISKIRSGCAVRPDLVMRLAAAVLVYELHPGPTPAPEQDTGTAQHVWAVPPNGLPALTTDDRAA
ncbi:MAG: hypothetical protein ACRDNP_01805 [Gaiellaceae bacterium]